MAVFNNKRILFAPPTNAAGGGGKDMLQARVDATNSCQYLFYQYGGTTLDISRLDTSHVTNMTYMFNHCVNITVLNLSNFDTSNVRTMDNMLSSCQLLTTLDLSNFDTSNVTTMAYMFYDCGNMTGLNLSGFNTSNVVAMNGMFRECGSLTTLDLSDFNTSNVTSMNNMFAECTALTDILGAINMVKVVDAERMFDACTNLTSVNLKNIKTNLQLGSGTDWGHLLSAGALINVINELWDMTGSPAKTLTIGSANIAKLANFYVKLISITDAMREADEYIDNKVPCALCESTLDGAMSILDYAQNIKNWVIA